MFDSLSLPKNWLLSPLEECLELNQSGIWGDEVSIEQIGYPILRSTNIQNGNLLVDDVAFRNVKPDIAEKYTLTTGDLIVTKSSGSPHLIGKTAIFLQPENDSQSYLFSNFTQRLRTATSILLPYYLYFYLNSAYARTFLEQIQSTTSGLRNLDMKLYASQPIPLPPIEEQQEIVTILRYANDLRRLRKEANEKAQTLASACYEEMFGEPQPNWQEYKLKELISLEPGKSIRAHPHPASEGKWGILKVSAVTYGQFLPEENKELPDDLVQNQGTFSGIDRCCS
jgi:type I restriction enzyme, S subunit